MLIEVKHKYTGEVLFAHDCENNSIKVTVEEAVKQGVSLNGADLHYANLTNADLRYANLSSASLDGANLRGATLNDASLNGADLHYANLSGATLNDASLNGADLRCANLSGADLNGASFEGVWWYLGSALTKAPLRITDLHWPVQIGDTVMKIGCQIHTLEQWRDFTDAQIAQMDGREALRFWREHKDSLFTQARAHGCKI